MNSRQKLFLVLKLASFVAVMVFAWVRMSNYVSVEKRESTHYDERMWTGTSIKSYFMFYEDYQPADITVDGYPVAQIVAGWPQIQQQASTEQAIEGGRMGWFMGYAAYNDVDIPAMDAKQIRWLDDNMWTFGWKAPLVGKLIMGRSVVNGTPDIDPNGYLAFDEEVGRRDASPTQQMIELARKPNGIMLVMTAALIFVIGWAFVHYGVGLIASLFLLLNETFLKVMTNAGLDSPSIFFGTLTVLAALLYLREFYRPTKEWKLVLFSVLTGLAFPLAVGSKLNAALIGYVAIIVFVLVAIGLLMGGKAKATAQASAKGKKKKAKAAATKTNPKRKAWIRLAYSAAIIGILTYSLFLNYNPMFKGNTRAMASVVQSSVDDFFAIRAQSYANKPIELPTNMNESLGLIFKRNFINTMEVVGNDEEGDGRYYGTVGNLIPFKGNLLDGLFIIMGFIFFTVTGVAVFLRDRKVSAYAFLSIFFLVILLGNAGFIWIDWARYHMAMYTAFALAFGTGVMWAIALASKKLMKRDTIEFNPA